MTRPELAPGLAPEIFSQWYWLSAELRRFCSAAGLPTSGSKAELTDRVRGFLAGDLPRPAAATRPRSRPLPARLTADTVIAPGWKLSGALRAFFLAEIGPSFRFNQALRDLFRAPAGQTLGEAIALYRAGRAAPPPIGPQFEFNRHMRDYFATHPQGTRAEALRLWHARREKPGGGG